MNAITLVGHICLDEVIINGKRQKLRLGGAVSYGYITAVSYNVPIKIISKVGSDFPKKFLKFFGQASFTHILVDKFHKTTRFLLDYHGSKRTIRLLARCAALEYSDIASYVSENDLLHFGLLVREVSPEVISRINAKLKLLDLQGYMRHFDDKGNLTLEPRELPKVDILHAEIKEALIESQTTRIRDMFFFFQRYQIISLITLGNGGAFVVTPQHIFYAPPAATRIVVDETGAGDVFSTAFLIEYNKNNDIRWAVAKATAAASLSIELKGAKPFKYGKELEARAEEVHSRIHEF